MPETPVLRFSDNEEANRLLGDDAFALLVGMLLDQQVPMERAFSAPYDLKQRLAVLRGPNAETGLRGPNAETGRLDPAEIAAMDPDELASVFAQRPALHRFPGSMAGRTQALARSIVDNYEGDAAQVWARVGDGAQLLANLRELPGFGEQKARIFVALLAKRLGVQPPGWEDAAGPYGQPGWFSVADIDGPESLARVREHKRAVKAEAKTKAAKK